MSGWLKRNSAWQLLQTTAASGSELVVLLGFASAASAQSFGAFVVALSATKLVFLVFEPRIHEFLTPKLARYLGRSPRGAWRSVRWSRRLEGALNAAAFALCIAVAFAWPRFQPSVDGWLIAACACYNFANTLLKFSSLAIFRCLGQVRVAAILSVLTAALKLGVVAGALLAGVPIVSALFWMALGTAAIGLTQAVVAHHRLGVAQPAPPARPFRPLRAANRHRQIKLLLSNYGTGIVEIVHRELDVQIAAALAGVAEAGRYRIAKTMAMVMLEALNPVVTILLPELARKMAADSRAAVVAFVRRVALSLGVLGSLAGIAVFGASAAYVTWIANAQRGALLPTAILIASFAIAAPGLWAQVYLVAAGRSHLYLRSSAVGAVCATLLALFLVPRLGAVGSASAHAIGLLVTTILAFWSARILLGETGERSVAMPKARRFFGRST